jgi:hypothetical protein
METVLKSFSVGFLLRSVFAGAFFVLAYCSATRNTCAQVEVNAANVFYFGVVLALVAGVTVYGIHRSAIYPWFEWFLYADWAKRVRERRGFRLISDNVICDLVKRWDDKAEEAQGASRMRSRAEQITLWGDYIHLQYTSAWCILFGYLAGKLAGRPGEMRYWGLFTAIAVFFVVSATSSAWRSRSVEEHWAPAKKF